eukprot:1141537-Pelagomonas_calceolata.AAC.2
MHKAFCWTRLIYSLTPSSKAEHAYNVPCSPGLRINAAACPRPICTCSLKQSGALNDMLPCCKDYDLQDKVEQCMQYAYCPAARSMVCRTGLSSA